MLTYNFASFSLRKERELFGSDLPGQPESKSRRVPEGYSGEALKLLTDAGAESGSKIRIKTNDGFEATGLLIPRYESVGSDSVVLKLKSGYNIGLDAGSISSISVLEVEEPARPPPAATNGGGPKSGKGKAVLLLSTGGTIASRVDYRTGAVKPAYTASDLYSSIPELSGIADVRCEVVFSTFSENLYQPQWKDLSERIIAESNEKLDGIVVMLGTDTLAFVSAALSFSLLGLDHPVVCVGAQRSSDRPSADSASNLKAAVRFAGYSKSSGVFVAMHKDESDDTIAIHSGVRVRKNHTSKRDAFQSIDVPHYAEVRDSKILFDPASPPRGSLAGRSSEFHLKTDFDPNVSLVKFHPGFDPSLLDYLAGRTKGIIVEGTGLGHVSSNTVGKIREIARRGIFVGISSQCIWGHVDLNVYETGIDLLDAGAVPLGNMLSETAYVKLSWAIANFAADRVRRIMTENLVGESTARIELSPRESETVTV